MIDEKATILPAGELQEKYWDKTAVVRVVREGEVLTKDDSSHLQLGDEIYILASTHYFTENIPEIAVYFEEFAPSVDIGKYTETAQIVVINKKVIGMSPEDLDIAQSYGVLITSVVRMRMEMPQTPDLKIRKGDILNVVGPNESIEKLGKEIGHVEKEIAETNARIKPNTIFCLFITLLLSNIRR